MNTIARHHPRPGAARQTATRRLSAKVWRRADSAAPAHHVVPVAHADGVGARAEVNLEPWVPREYAL
jgi:hypothetical protein